MKISKLIEELKKLEKKHGNIEVFFRDFDEKLWESITYDMYLSVDQLETGGGTIQTGDLYEDTVLINKGNFIC